MEATIIRRYEPTGPEDSGQSGLAALEHDGSEYVLDYSDSCGLSVMRRGDFPSHPLPGWCGVNTDESDRLRPGYYDESRRWVDVPASAADLEVRRWAARNYRALFGLVAPRPAPAPGEAEIRSVESGRLTGGG